MATRAWSLANAVTRGWRKGGPVQGAAKRGIFCGKHIGFGNSVSEYNNKNRRSWKVNSQWKRFWSETLGYRVEVRVSAAAVKNIRKAGGFEEFLINNPRLIRDSDKGQELREQIIKVRAERERAAILHHYGITE